MAIGSETSRAAWMVAVAWMVAAVAGVAFFGSLELRRLEQQFVDVTEEAYDRLSDRAQDAEAAAMAFSAFVGIAGAHDSERLAGYARQLLSRYPQIQGLEVATRVARADLPRFEAAHRARGLEDFRVRSFSYDGERVFEAVAEKADYYPIVFMEPMPAESRQVMGLDIDSVPVLREAMQDAARSGAVAPSRPFRLVEGPVGYVLLMPVPAVPAAGGQIELAPGELFVLVVMRADQLIAPRTGRMRTLAARVSLDAREVAGDAMPMVEWASPARGPLESALLPHFEARREATVRGQPLSLDMAWQVGWEDLDGRLLTAGAGVGLVIFGLLVAFLRAEGLRGAERRRSQEQLAYLANHDALTGLPNRHLLLDRVSQALARAARHGTPLALLFLDLDGFKGVNDRHGHEVGDELLKKVAQRLARGVRAQDTVARIGGDEFVAVLEETDRSGARVVASKLKQEAAETYDLPAGSVRVGVSVGVACYPEDGASVDELLRRADGSMYREKMETRAGT